MNKREYGTDGIDGTNGKRRFLFVPSMPSVPHSLLILLLLLQIPVVGRAQGETPPGMPMEKGNLRRPDLVELIKLDPAIKLDIRYATPKNFLGRAVYRESRAFLQRPAANALVRVNRSLQKQGYGLLVFDGYRPWSVTKLFWDETPQDKRNFVADPAKGSRHNRGCAVDLSLYDLKTGRELQMPSAYDEFTERAYPSYQGGSAEQRRLRDLLRSVMEAQGFSVNQYEWWHFDYKGWKQYPILNISFNQLGR